MVNRKTGDKCFVLKVKVELLDYHRAKHALHMHCQVSKENQQLLLTICLSKCRTFCLDLQINCWKKKLSF